MTVRHLLASLALGLVVVSSAPAAGGAGAGEFAFYPQAGTLWRDLYPTNFVDLDPGPALRDYACGTQTYDGHTGTDTVVRSFREMDIGVPVFAALDGEVISVQDGAFDRNHGPTVTLFDNHVVLEHGPGRFTIYGHLREGIDLRRGDRVVAGRQIGWTASSGNSSWPHLHFTSQVDGQVNEPFAGPCDEGASGWASQAAWPTEPYLKDFAVTAKQPTGRRDLPHDEAVRTGTFVAGTSLFYTRIEVGAADPARTGLLQVRIVRPDGTTAQTSTATMSTPHGHGYWWFRHQVRLSTVGRWRIVVEFEGKERADVPLTVVATSREVRNRRPNAVRVELEPAEPTPNDVIQCRVSTSLVSEDPDFEIVRYRYRWTVGGKLVRAVRSAALSDVLRKGAAVSGKVVRCSVTPGDGNLSGRTSAASAVSR